MELELQVENIIIQNKCITFCDLYTKLVPEIIPASVELKLLLKSIVAKLIVKNNWRTKCTKGRLYITAELAHDKSNKAVTIKHHCGKEEVFIPKYLPENGDWEITYNRERDLKYYYDGKIAKHDARWVVAKLENIPFEHINICRYHKTPSFRTMHNFE